MTEKDLVRHEAKLREEFNRWAEAGYGEQMREEHLYIAQKMLAQISFAPDDKILDVGCGAGWLVGLLADKVPRGQFVGMDVADEMIRRARKEYLDRINVMFITAGVDDIPWDENFFNKGVSVESAYYWPDPDHGLGEVLRVLQPGGQLWVLINLYKENVYSHQWVEKLPVPVHLLSGREWSELMHKAGFIDIWFSRVVDDRPVPEGCQSDWFGSAEELRRFRAEGALLLYGRKPAL